MNSSPSPSTESSSTDSLMVCSVRIRSLVLAAFALAAFVGTSKAQTSAYLNFPTTAGGAMPQLLSQTGAFSDVTSLTVSPGIVEFDVNQPLWSDAAGKLRWIAVPTGTGISFSAKENWDYPPGTVFIKHFELGEERHRLETRITVMTAGGGAYFRTYKWRSDNSDADLLGEDGLTESVFLENGQVQKWSYPSHSECADCHNDGSDLVLGPKTRQLNMDGFDPVSNSTRNQLVTWNQLGLFDPAIDESMIPTYDALTRITDETKGVEERVRAYLDVNCSICHNAVDPPSTAAPFDVRYNTPLAETGIINGQLFIGAGVAGGRVIKPQDPTRSLMHFRLSTNDPEERMPPLGRNVVHEEARDLILRWLLSLDPIASLDIPDYRSRWLFDGDLTDETGLADGSWRNDPVPANFSSGRDGQAVSVSGATDAVDIGNYDLSGSAFTVALWIKANLFAAAEDVLLAKSSGTGDQDYYWSMSVVNGSQLRVRVKTNGTTTVLTSAPGIVPEESWIHVGAVYDGSMLRLYSDGAEVASQPVSGAIDTDGAVPASIGNLPASAGAAPFDGMIDDVRFYARGLSAGDFNRVLEAALIQNEAPVVEIDDPGSDRFVLNLTNIEFSGTSLDPEEGDLSGGLEWFSGRDGVFGNGATVNWNKLTVGEHIIVLTSQDDEGVASSDTINVTVAPGFEKYIESFNLFGGDLLPLADTDNDQRTQLAEYAFLSNPLRGDGSAVRAQGYDDPGGGGRFLAIQFDVSKLALDLEYVVQISPDLQSWTDAAVYTPEGDGIAYSPATGSVQVTAANEGDVVHVLERLETSGPGGGFIRVVVRLL